MFLLIIKYLLLGVTGFAYIIGPFKAIPKFGILGALFIVIIFLIYFFIGYFITMIFIKNNIEITTARIILIVWILVYIILYLYYKPSKFFDIFFVSEYNTTFIQMGIMMSIFPIEISKYVALFVANRRYDKQLEREIEAEHQFMLKQEEERLAKEQAEEEHRNLEKRYMEHVLSQDSGSTSKYDELKKLSDLKNEGILSEEEYLAEKSKLLG